MIKRRKTKGEININRQIQDDVSQMEEHSHEGGKQNNILMQENICQTSNNKDKIELKEGEKQVLKTNESCSSFLGDKIDLDSIAQACQEQSIEENNLKFVAYEIIDTQRQQQERLEDLIEQLKQAQDQLKDKDMKIQQIQVSLGDTISFLKLQLEKVTENSAVFQEKASKACLKVQQLEGELSIKDGIIDSLKRELHDSQQIHSRCIQTKPNQKILRLSKHHHQKENIMKTSSNLPKNESHQQCSSSQFISTSQGNSLSSSLTFEILQDNQKQLDNIMNQTNKNKENNNNNNPNYSQIKNQDCSCSTTFQTTSSSSSHSNAHIEQHFQNLDTIPLDMLLQQIRTSTTGQVNNSIRKNSIVSNKMSVPPSSCTSSPSNKSISFDTMNRSNYNSSSNTPSHRSNTYRNKSPKVILSTTARQQKQARGLNMTRPASSKQHQYSSSPGNFRAVNPYFDSRWVGLVHPLANNSNNTNSKNQFIPSDSMLFTKSPLQRKNKNNLSISQARVNGSSTVSSWNSTTNTQHQYQTQSPSISMRNTVKNRHDFRKVSAQNYLEIR